MVRIIGHHIKPEEEELFNKSVTLRNNFFSEMAQKKDVVYNQRSFKSLVAGSAFPSLAQIWNALTEGNQTDWDNAGYWSDQSGWALFAQDTLYRIRHGMLNAADPSEYHQFLVGEIKIESPASSIRLRQVYTGFGNTPVWWALNAKSMLESVGAGSYAKLIVTVKTGYWNDDINQAEIIVFEYDLAAMTEWDYPEDFYEDGFTGSYSVTFEIAVYNMRGLLYIDGVTFNYNDENHSPDYQCNNFHDSWQAVSAPTGASWQTVYPLDD